MEIKDEERMATIPLIAHQLDMAKFERTTKRLIIALVLVVILLFASNAMWLYEWCQYDYSDVTIDSQDGGNANYLQAGANGAITNGASGSQEEGQEE
jgi:hypothetical protein